MDGYQMLEDTQTNPFPGWPGASCIALGIPGSIVDLRNWQRRRCAVSRHGVRVWDNAAAATARQSDPSRSPTSIIANMRVSILPVLLLCASAAESAVVHVPIKSNLVLKPNQAYTVTVDAIE